MRVAGARFGGERAAGGGEKLVERVGGGLEYGDEWVEGEGNPGDRIGGRGEI